MNSFPSITQHCVIEEQDDHLVIALRVSKAEIAANIHLLAGLANVVPRENIPARPAPRNWRHIGYAAALVVAILSPSPFGPVTSISFASSTPPVEYRGWHMAKPTFKVGEDIDTMMQYHRDRVCATTFDRVITKATPAGVWDKVYSSRSFGNAEPNHDFQDLHILLHDTKLTPGSYMYSGVTHSECNNGAFDTPHDTLAFSVVD